MLDKLAGQMNPKTAKAIKIGTIAVAVVAGAVVTGVVLYKLGLVGNTAEAVEEIVETAAQAA
jgi:high-affinity Fe2+/Pb2+ permease